MNRGARIGTLVEGVEHNSVRLVVRGHLEHVAAAHPSERHAVVEEQRARILFANPLSLQAEAREDEQLRINGKLQGVERRRQETAVAIE